MKCPTIEMGHNKRDKANKFVAMVLAQTFHYMIVSGLEYSYFTSGEALVFLRIKANDSPTAYYHLVVPNEEVEPKGGSGLRFFYRAISQVASFCLMMFQSKPWS